MVSCAASRGVIPRAVSDDVYRRAASRLVWSSAGAVPSMYAITRLSKRLTSSRRRRCSAVSPVIENPRPRISRRSRSTSSTSTFARSPACAFSLFPRPRVHACESPLCPDPVTLCVHKHLHCPFWCSPVVPSPLLLSFSSSTGDGMSASFDDFDCAGAADELERRWVQATTDLGDGAARAVAYRCADGSAATAIAPEKGATPARLAEMVERSRQEALASTASLFAMLAVPKA